MTVTVSPKIIALETAVYQPRPGSVKVNLTPPAAVESRWKWRRVGASTWQNSGATITNIPAGQHQIELKDGISAEKDNPGFQTGPHTITVYSNQLLNKPMNTSIIRMNILEKPEEENRPSVKIEPVTTNNGFLNGWGA